jgi:hypothetical protein
VGELFKISGATDRFQGLSRALTTPSLNAILSNSLNNAVVQPQPLLLNFQSNSLDVVFRLHSPLPSTAICLSGLSTALVGPLSCPGTATFRVFHSHGASSSRLISLSTRPQLGGALVVMVTITVDILKTNLMATVYVRKWPITTNAIRQNVNASKAPVSITTTPTASRTTSLGVLFSGISNVTTTTTSESTKKVPPIAIPVPMPTPSKPAENGDRREDAPPNDRKYWQRRRRAQGSQGLVPARSRGVPIS